LSPFPFHYSRCSTILDTPLMSLLPLVPMRFPLLFFRCVFFF
jgi:hypothetical protein